MEVYKDYSKMALKQELYKLLYRLSHIRTLSSHEYLQYNRNSISILKQRVKSVKRLLEKLEDMNRKDFRIGNYVTLTDEGKEAHKRQTRLFQSRRR